MSVDTTELKKSASAIFLAVEEDIARDISGKLNAAAKEIERLRELAKLNNQIIHNSVVEKQAAWIEWRHGKGAEEAMKWIHNSLWGPGFIPDDEEIKGQSSHEFYQANCWEATTGLNT